MATDETKASPEDRFRHKIIMGSKSRMSPLRNKWDKFTRMYRGSEFDNTIASGDDTDDMPGMGDEEGILVENNWLYAFVDTLVANVSPSNPECTIVARRRDLQEAAQLREAMVNDLFYKENVHSKIWKLVTRSAIYPRAFVKAVWSRKKGRPIYRVLNPEFVFFDAIAEDWDDIRYICEVTVLTEGEFKKRLKKRGKKGGFYRHDALEDVQFGDYPKWLTDSEESGEDGSDHEVVRRGYKWVTVYEYYDLIEEKFYHYIDGTAQPVFAGELPYTELPNPFGMLVFNDNIRDLGGISDAELVYPTIQRMDELSTLKMWHLKATMPVTVIHEGLVDDPADFNDAYLNVSGPGQSIIMAAKPNVGIQDVIGVVPMPALPVEWGPMEQQLVELVELVFGLAGYQRGAVGEGDIATEFALADTAIKTRNARRQKAVYDVIAFMAKAAVALYSQFLDEDVWIPVPVGGDENLTQDVDRMKLLLDRQEEAFDYDYQARPFNAQEGNSVVQIKTIVEFLPTFTENPNTSQFINQRELMKKLLTLLQMPELLAEQATQAQPVGGQENPDLMGTAAMGGATPSANPQGLPAEAAGPMLGGQVLSGSGAQAIPGGMEGGNQPL